MSKITSIIGGCGVQLCVEIGRQMGRQNANYDRRGDQLGVANGRQMGHQNVKWDAKTSITRGVGAQSPVPNGRQMGRQNVNYERRGRSSVGPNGTPKRQL